MILLYVALGSAVGGVSRFLLGGFLQTRSGVTFPVGTLVINVVGSFLLGFLARYASAEAGFSPETRALLTAGFCGGFTTFSTFSLEALQLFEQGEYGKGGLYLLTSVTLALAATVGGVMLARAVVE
ncbi:MAG: fluoride efflux transporter CrcB [Gemmatimonadaceae bacterium]